MSTDGVRPDVDKKAEAMVARMGMLGRNARRAQPPKPLALTTTQALFLRSKGQAFRELWVKRLERGLTPLQMEQLDHCLFEWAREMGIELPKFEDDK